MYTGTISSFHGQFNDTFDRICSCMCTEGFFRRLAPVCVCVCPLDPIAEQNWKLILFAFLSQECLAVAQTRTFKKQFCKLELISQIQFNLFYWVCFCTWQHFQNGFCRPEKFSLLIIKTGNKLLIDRAVVIQAVLTGPGFVCAMLDRLAVKRSHSTDRVRWEPGPDSDAATFQK